eukprot:jgi/Hompol1/6375/HPOL_002257-RA
MIAVISAILGAILLLFGFLVVRRALFQMPFKPVRTNPEMAATIVYESMRGGSSSASLVPSHPPTYEVSVKHAPVIIVLDDGIDDDAAASPVDDDATTIAGIYDAGELTPHTRDDDDEETIDDAEDDTGSCDGTGVFRSATSLVL